MLRCGRCGDFICPRCSIQTPVGARCPNCARLRRLPQFDVSAPLLIRSAAAGLAVSAVAWYILSYIPFFRIFLAIPAGFAVGEVMSRAARRRSNRVLEVAAALVIVGGWLAVALFEGFSLSALSDGQSLTLTAALPLVVAIFAAVTKLR